MSFFPETISVRLTKHQKEWLAEHAKAYPELWVSDADVVRAAIQHFMLCPRGVSRITKFNIGEKDERTRDRSYER